ncbi:uncharacterized protein LOC111404699 [Olea europaea var. sylvestris]|uniref:uncharacterized protein LOC111404699 n=1 Tax=Olea europaea var. sylvestris TaxID=158386 RepID=UPI000C1D0220|nr:uncharacterized protein LOC111404699 [Olea europaea var. sylvestris]
MEIWNKVEPWELKCPGDCSWIWRKILGLRDIGRDKMKFKIGNGILASLWFVIGHPLGPLERILGERIVHESRLSRLAKVVDIVDGDTWRWPSACSLALSDFMQGTLDTFRQDCTREDVLRWVHDVHGVFSVRSAWESLRPCCPRVTWYHIVWFPKCIPRYAFILWLAIQGGLYPQTKLLRFGLIQSMRCVLCGCSGEDLDHLFFACPFSEHVWQALHSMRCVLCGCSGEDLDHLFFACPFSEHVWQALHLGTGEIKEKDTHKDADRRRSNNFARINEVPSILDDVV